MKNVPSYAVANKTDLKKNLQVFVLYFTVFLIMSLGIQNLMGAYSSDRAKHADEAAHFVSSLAIADYISSGAHASPVAFMKDYYAHFPKVAIGHWPPVFEIIQAIMFLIFGGTGLVALRLQAVLFALCVALSATVLGRSAGLFWGILSGLIVFASPFCLDMVDEVMADTLLATLVILSAITWSRFYQSRKWFWCVIFALTASAAILTKGSAFGLALLPPIYLLVRRDIRFLLNKKTIVSAVIVAILTVPWYVVTYHMAADGFLYPWGWGFTSRAIPFYAKALFLGVGIPCGAMYIIGTVWSFYYERQKDTITNQPDILAFSVTALSILFFTLLVPTDLVVRYLVAIIPCMAVISVWSLKELANKMKFKRSSVLLTGLFAGVVVVCSVLSVFRVPESQPFHSDTIVKDILESQKPNQLVLVGGSVLAEGAVVSSFAEQDKLKSHYVVRAQKVLATTNWMGTQYTLKFNSADEIADWIKRNQIGWIIYDTTRAYKFFAHNTLLKELLDDGRLNAELVEAETHTGGVISLYRLPAADTAADSSNEVFSELGPGHLGGIIK